MMEKEKDSNIVLAELRTQLRSGQLKRVPSTRQLAASTGFHRNTCSKILLKLKDEGLITVNSGAAPTIIGAENDPVDNAIDYLLNQGMDFNTAKKQILKALQKRKAIVINSPNEDLIRYELDGFNFNPSGLIISDQPQQGCDFLLQLSDIRPLIKNISIRGVVGIVSKSESFRNHVFGTLNCTGEIMSVEPTTRLVRSVFAFCHQVICDRLIADRLREYARQYKREHGKTITVIPAHYLHPQTIINLRGKLIDV